MANKKKLPPLRPLHIEIYDEDTLQESLEGTTISDVATIANEFAGLSANSHTPLSISNNDSDADDQVELKNSANVTALVIKFQPNHRGSPFGNKQLTPPKPRLLVGVPNFNLIDNKILQTFYAKNLGKLKIKCKFEDVDQVVKTFGKLLKEGKMDFDYNIQELAEKKEEIKKIIIALEFYEDNPNSAPPPRLFN